ncbi:MAG: nuclear transport factor 2 family protein [Bacteroidota bacterium]
MKTLLLFSLLALGASAAQERTPEQIVQENLDFYNQGDIEGFMRSFSDDIALYEFGKAAPSYRGRDAIRTVYARLFTNSPDLHSTIVHRTVLGNKVIDHEHITGRNGSNEPLELVLIYEVNTQHIVKMTVIRK